MLQYRDDHFLIESNHNCKRLNISRKKQFTISEGIKLFQIMGQNKAENLNRITFWQNVEKNNVLPERTAD